jgi:hypothetical protein
MTKVDHHPPFCPQNSCQKLLIYGDLLICSVQI